VLTQQASTAKCLTVTAAKALAQPKPLVAKQQQIAQRKQLLPYPNTLLAVLYFTTPEVESPFCSS
jgi:hypothetical protein